MSLCKLLCLPARVRFSYKSTLCYNFLRGLAPGYTSEMLKPYHPLLSLRTCASYQTTDISESRSFSFSGPSEFIASYFVQWPSSTPSGLATFVNSSSYWCPPFPIFSPFLSLFSFLPFLPCFAVDNAFQLLLTNDNAVSRVSSPLTNVYFSSSDHWVWKRILCAVGALSINI